MMPVSEIRKRERIPLLYVAGPYTRDDPIVNTHHAIRVAAAIYETNRWVPIVPHLTLLWHLITPRPLEYWYRYDLHLLARCDAVVRLPGASTGADAEIDYAHEREIEEIMYDELPFKARSIWDAR